jgi:pyruvate-formate lyase-activating enzyme
MISHVHTNAIAPRAAHQQRVENLVHTAGFLGKTKVEEVRRSARAKIHCIFYRDFKIWSLAILRKKTDRENEERMQQLTQNLQTQQQPIHLQMKQTPQKVDGANRLEMMSEWMDLQYEAIEAARKSLGYTERMKSIIRDINDPKDKSSAEDNAAKFEQIQTYLQVYKELTCRLKTFV